MHRQEAGRIGGLGACGRELCCASWISSFSSVTTNTARMQELSLNPQKLAGQCSKLKCCLAYEYDTYADARRDFPRVKEPLQALDGEYYLVKSDILARTMQFSSSKDALVNVTTLSVERVKEIQALNRAGKKVDRLLAEQDVPPPRRNRPIVRRRTASPVSTASAATTSAVAATGRARRATGRPKALREPRSQPDRKPALRIGDNGCASRPQSAKKAAVRSAAAVKTVRRRAANGRAGSVAPDVAETAAATVKTAAVKVATATVAASAAGRAAAPIAAAVREMPTVPRRALRGERRAARAIRSNGPKRDGRWMRLSLNESACEGGFLTERRQMKGAKRILRAGLLLALLPGGRLSFAASECGGRCRSARMAGGRGGAFSECRYARGMRPVARRALRRGLRGRPVDLEVTTVAPDSLRATEPFTLRLALSRGPSPLLCDTAVLYRRRAVLRCAGDYRMTIRPCRPVRGIEAVGVTIEKSI